MRTAWNTIGAPWADVRTFYDQAGFGLLNVQVTESNEVVIMR